MLPLFFSFLLALPADPVTVLQPDRVFDRVSSIHEGWVVAIQGEKIIFAGPKTSFKPPTNAQILLLSGTTLTPGLIDAHSHLLLHPYDEAKWEDQVSKEPVAERQELTRMLAVIIGHRLVVRYWQGAASAVVR